jgi:hypothetical protein
MSLHSLDTEDLEMPLIPMAWTSSSTRRVLTPAPRLLDHRDQRFLNGLPRFQKARKVSASPQLGDL